MTNPHIDQLQNHETETTTTTNYRLLEIAEQADGTLKPLTIKLERPKHPQDTPDTFTYPLTLSSWEQLNYDNGAQWTDDILSFQGSLIERIVEADPHALGVYRNPHFNIEPGEIKIAYAIPVISGKGEVVLTGYTSFTNNPVEISPHDEPYYLQMLGLPMAVRLSCTYEGKVLTSGSHIITPPLNPDPKYLQQKSESRGHEKIVIGEITDVSIHDGNSYVTVAYSNKNGKHSVVMKLASTYKTYSPERVAQHLGLNREVLPGDIAILEYKHGEASLAGLLERSESAKITLQSEYEEFSRLTELFEQELEKQNRKRSRRDYSRARHYLMQAYKLAYPDHSDTYLSALQIRAAQLPVLERPITFPVKEGLDGVYLNVQLKIDDFLKHHTDLSLPLSEWTIGKIAKNLINEKTLASLIQYEKTNYAVVELLVKRCNQLGLDALKYKVFKSVTDALVQTEVPSYQTSPKTTIRHGKIHLLRMHTSLLCEQLTPEYIELAYNLGDVVFAKLQDAIKQSNSSDTLYYLETARHYLNGLIKTNSGPRIKQRTGLLESSLHIAQLFKKRAGTGTLRIAEWIEILHSFTNKPMTFVLQGRDRTEDVNSLRDDLLVYYNGLYKESLKASSLSRRTYREVPTK